MPNNENNHDLQGTQFLSCVEFRTDGSADVSNIVCRTFGNSFAGMLVNRGASGGTLCSLSSQQHNRSGDDSTHSMDLCHIPMDLMALAQSLLTH